MKQIYDEFDESRHRAETITGIIFTIICGLLIAWSLGGCVKRPVQPHTHQAECWHNTSFKCEMPGKYLNFNDGYHCSRWRCGLCGEWMKN